MNTTKTETIEEIARRILGLASLETRNNDADDFHDLATWTIREALEAAYEAGAKTNQTATTRVKTYAHHRADGTIVRVTIPENEQE